MKEKEKEKHLDIREKLQSLPSVKASDEFVMKLQRRINLAEARPSTQIHKQHQEKLEGGFFAKLFGPSKNAWMVPAIGVTAVVFLVFIWVFVVNQNNMTTSDNNKTQTITQSEDQKQGSGENLTSTDEEKNNVGETLKTDLPGKEITSTFGYTDSRREIDRKDMDGGTVPSVTDETIGKPEVKMVPEKVTTEEREETVKGIKGIDDKNKEEENSSMNTGILKKSATPPPDKNQRGQDSLGNNEKDNIKTAEQKAKKVNRNVIDQTDLENLQEKVQESIK